MDKFTVDIIIPTYRPGKTFDRLMQMLKKQTYPIQQICIVNTSEVDFPRGHYKGTSQIQIHHIAPEEFDHGGTRDKAARMLSGDILLFMTQDAVPQNEYTVEHLCNAFLRESVSAAYARQLPDSDCSFLERYTRSFNYGNTSMIKSKQDLDKLGIKTFFCSNVCAAYRRTDYLALGGFEKHTIFNEDMIFAGKLIQAGKEITYVAEARVIHSHNYGNIQQFRRNFDLAVSQAQHPEIFTMAKSEDEGKKLVVQTARYACRMHKPWMVPELVIKSGFKFIGYKFGKQYKRLPKKLILKFTMNPSYWIR